VTFSDILGILDDMGGLGAVAEPLVVIALLIGGTWINRDFNLGRSRRQPTDTRRLSDEFFNRRVLESRDTVPSLLEDDVECRPISPSLLACEEPRWRTRTLGVWGVQRKVRTPNTRRFKGYILSRLLEKFPFLVECWYWALIYWVSIPSITGVHALGFPTSPSQVGIYY
jgi:hypothetical protein